MQQKTLGIVVLLATSALIALGVPRAFAGVTTEQITACESKRGSLDSRIDACSAVMDGTRSASAKAKARARKIDALEDRGDSLKAKGDLDGALRDYGDVLTLNSNNTSVLLKRGLIYRDRGERDKAIIDLENALKHDKRSIDAMNALSHLYYDKRDFAHAISVLDLAIKLKPNDALAYYNRGIAYRAKGEPDRAITLDSVPWGLQRHRRWTRPPVPTRTARRSDGSVTHE